MSCVVQRLARRDGRRPMGRDSRMPCVASLRVGREAGEHWWLHSKEGRGLGYPNQAQREQEVGLFCEPKQLEGEVMAPENCVWSGSQMQEVQRWIMEEKGNESYSSSYLGVNVYFWLGRNNKRSDHLKISQGRFLPLCLLKNTLQPHVNLHIPQAKGSTLISTSNCGREGNMPPLTHTLLIW